MLDVLYNDLPADELAFELACESAALRADRAAATYRAICEKAELDLREAELICIQESGDMDSLENLYMEAEEKTADKKQGVLASIWGAIKAFFGKIRDFFTGKKKEIDPKSSGQINQGTDNFFKRGIAKIREFLGKVKNLVAEHKVASIALAAATTLGGFVAIKSILSKNKDAENEAGKAKDPKETTALVTITGSTAISYIDAGNALCEQGEKMADDLVDMKIEEPSVAQLAKEIVHKICETIKAQMGKITSVFLHLKDRVKDKFRKKDGETSDGDNSGNNTPNTKDSDNKIEDKSGSQKQIEDKKDSARKAQSQAAQEWERYGATWDESVLTRYDDDDDIMIESSDDYYSYNDEDSYTESADDNLDDLIGDLL